MDEDDYVFTSTLDTPSSKEADAFHKIAKKALANKVSFVPAWDSFPKR